MTKPRLEETKVGGRLICKCGGEQFVINNEIDAFLDNHTVVVDNVECTKCHNIFSLHYISREKKHD